MTKRGGWVLSILIASSLGAETQPTGIRRLAWLAGCWESVSPERTIEEQWMAPRGKNMIGVARTVHGDDLIEYELVVVREQDDRLAYHAHPSGQPSAVFLSISVTDAGVLFENLDHDFPQRVGYQRKGTDSLLAWIEGTHEGQVRRVEFPYRRVTCPGDPK